MFVFVTMSAMLGAADSGKGEIKFQGKTDTGVGWVCKSKDWYGSQVGGTRKGGSDASTLWHYHCGATSKCVYYYLKLLFKY